MLTAQAHTLDAIFHRLAQKATHSEYLNELDANLRLALKAQSQCRTTLETLAAIKNPQPLAFVRQANIAHGPQQVNNDAAQSGEPPRAQETKTAKQTFGDTGMKNGWTQARKARQSGLIQRWKPWERSTCPRTPEGKAHVSRNAYKGGTRSILRELSRLLRDQQRQVLRIVEG
jgi:hypothetical protein